MASLMEDLIDVLNKEEEQYQGLIELGKKKREVVIRADIKTLDEITATEQEVASNLQNLAKKRTRVLNDMATVLGRNPGGGYDHKDDFLSGGTAGRAETAHGSKGAAFTDRKRDGSH